MKHVLVVDDEEAVCWALQRALESDGYGVSVASSAEEAFERVADKRPDAVILDVRLPGMDGISALARLRQLTGDAPVIVATAFGNLATAVKAVENGAFDYLAKPFDLDQAINAVEQAIQLRELRDSSASEAAGARKDEPTPHEEIVGCSAAMQVVFKRIAMVAPHDSCVVITGESGAGKELAARAVHRYSKRSDKPFVPVHVAALNPSLVESELFGHVKGAFTGADQPRPGLLSLANGGSIFFDELGDIPVETQVKLLRVLDHGEMFPVGAKQPERLDIRILAATHQDLHQKVADGSFRHDLFFRLNVFQIHLPTLRERAEDIVPLAEFFLRKLEPKALPLLPETKKFLHQQSWRGNVRELRNALEHAAIIARDHPLLPEHFPAPTAISGSSNNSQSLDKPVRQWLHDRIAASGEDAPQNLHAELLQTIEPVLLQEVLEHVQGNRWVAAQWLGLNRATVRKKLRLYGLDDNADAKE